MKNIKLDKFTSLVVYKNPNTLIIYKPKLLEVIKYKAERSYTLIGLQALQMQPSSRYEHIVRRGQRVIFNRYKKKV